MSRFAVDFMDQCEQLLDSSRVDAHARAIRSAVVPGSVVVDIGCGVGVFAVLACQQGARKVYAIDPRPMIDVAREVAVANGCADRIQFIQADSHDVRLPELADVVVCDVRTALPEQQVSVMFDARTRFLAPNGTLIPSIDRLWTAVVHLPARHDSLVGIWRHHPRGWNADPAYRRSVHAWLAHRFSTEDIVSTPSCWTSIDYRNVESSNGLTGNASCTVIASEMAHGLCVWFESELLRDVVYTNQPSRSPHPFGAAYFPWPEPVALAAGDEVRTSFDATPTSSGYQWRWRTTISTASGVRRASFEQDTGRHTAAQDDRAVDRQESHSLRCRNHLHIDRFVLGAMDRGVSVGAIADALLEAFPRSFGSHGEALTYAGTLSARYG